MQDVIEEGEEVSLKFLCLNFYTRFYNKHLSLYVIRKLQFYQRIKIKDKFMATALLSQGKSIHSLPPQISIYSSNWIQVSKISTKKPPTEPPALMIQNFN